MDLQVGTRIKIGEEFAEWYGYDEVLKAGEEIELVEGTFEEDNGLYTYTSTAPSIWNEDEGEFDSIYHLFGNNLEYFKDCEIINH